MSEHYFTQQPDSKHNLEKWSFELFGRTFQFMTDSGVFSKKTIDFGSRVLLHAFQTENLPAGKILDVGCGYGPIGLALAFSTGRSVEMIDINQRAVELAIQNAKLNQITSVEIHTSNLYEKTSEKQYAAIISNPPIRAGKKVVHEILSGAFSLLKEKGTLTVVIQKKQGAPSAEKKMLEVFGNVEVLTKEKGYYILQSSK